MLFVDDKDSQQRLCSHYHFVSDVIFIRALQANKMRQKFVVLG